MKITKAQLKEHIRKIVRQCLNESNQWRELAAGRGVGDGTWRDGYPRGGDDEYPRKRRGSYETDEERNARLDYEDQKRLGLDEGQDGKSNSKEKLDDLISQLHDYQYQLKKSDPSDVDTRMDLRDKIEEVQEEIKTLM